VSDDSPHVTAGASGQLVEDRLHGRRHRVDERVDGLTRLEEDVGILGGAA